MNIIHKEHDYLQERHFDTTDLLLLHPDLLETELAKLESHCPIGIIETEEGPENIFIPNCEVVRERFSFNMIKYLPEDVVIPVAGLEGRYYIRAFQEYDHNLHKPTLFDATEYEIFDRRTNRQVVTEIFGKSLEYLGRAHAIFDNFIVTKNAIMMKAPDVSVCTSERSGCLITKAGKNRPAAIYDAEGNLLRVWPYINGLYEIEESQPTISAPKLPTRKNIQKYMDMIVASLKDCSDLAACESTDLLGICEYLLDHNLELAIDLVDLNTYRVDYAKYFRKLANEPDKKHEIKPVDEI